MNMSYIQSLKISYQHGLSYVSALIKLLYKQYNTLKLSAIDDNREGMKTDLNSYVYYCL